MAMTTVWKCVDLGHTSHVLDNRGGCSTCGSQGVYVEQVPTVPVVEVERKRRVKG